ncbi:MAG: rhodanese-like domain-containing protein [Fimbriimonadaceae bacterium]|nr:rhodanese-like domain-containing protein [Fimbriimonadaceae bacterium]
MDTLSAPKRPAELRETQDQVVDVRSASEFAAGHIPGSVNIPLEEVQSRLADLNDRPLVLVCKSGVRAAIAREHLSEHAPDASLLEGGFDEWRAQGLPVVQTTSSCWSLDRQVRLGAGILVLLGSGLGFSVHPGWFGLTGLVGLGLTFAGATDICGMAVLLAKMPWNRPRVQGAP